MGKPKIDIFQALSGKDKYRYIFDHRKNSLVTISELVKGKIKCIEIYNDKYLITLIDGRKYNWRMNSYDDCNFTVLSNSGEYDIEEENILKRIIKKHYTVFDVGANKGWYSILFSKLAIDGEVHSFEPIKSAFYELETNIRLNNCSNIIPNNKGLYSKTGIYNMYVPYNHSTLASMKKHYDTNSVLNKCEFTTIDEYIFTKNIPIVDFIKIDAEGAELEILKGATQLLTRDKPMIFIEIFEQLLQSFDSTSNDIQTFLVDLGYKLYMINDNKLVLMSNIYQKNDNDIIAICDKHKSEVLKHIK